jgi:tryptophan synthase alpha chain
MSRIQSYFKSLKESNKKALIPFITAGDPHPSETVKLMHALVTSGADMIELGIPFSDPIADGPVIQRASERALKNSVGITSTIKLAAEFRKENKDTPVILMGYANPIEAIGIDNFIDLINDAGVDGVITVDYPPEESSVFVSKLRKYDIDSIFLLSPTTDDDRIKLIVDQASGFLYYVSLKGVTGSANIDIQQVADRVKNIQKHTDLPIAVGFGVRDAKTANEVALVSDAVVIGSRIVREIEDADPDNLIPKINSLMTEIKSAIDSKREK